MSEIEKIYLSWEDIHKLSKNLIEIIKSNHPEIKGLVTVTRGGLIPSAIVASELNIRNIETIAICSYEEECQMKDMKILSLPTNAMKDLGTGWLVVDELVDTGQTLEYIKTVLPHASFYSLITKIDTDLINGYVEKHNPNSWIYFPWENE